MFSRGSPSVTPQRKKASVFWDVSRASGDLKRRVGGGGQDGDVGGEGITADGEMRRCDAGRKQKAKEHSLLFSAPCSVFFSLPALVF